MTFLQMFKRSLLLSLIYLAVSMPLLLSSLILPNPTELETNLLRALSCLTYTATVFILLKFFNHQPWSSLNLKISRSASLGFLKAVSITGLIIILSAYLAQFLFSVNLEMSYIDQRPLFSTFMAAFVLQAFPEELTFRSYLHTTLKGKLPHKILASCLSFGLMHLITLIGAPVGWLDIFSRFFYPFTFALLAYLLMICYQTPWAAVAVHGGIHVFRPITNAMNLADGLARDLLTSLLFLLVAMYIYKFKIKEDCHVLSDLVCVD